MSQLGMGIAASLVAAALLAFLSPLRRPIARFVHVFRGEPYSVLRYVVAANRSWWHWAAQPDGTFAMQWNAEVHVTNDGDRDNSPMLGKIRYHRGDVSEFHPSMTVSAQDRYGSRAPIDTLPPNQTARMSLFCFSGPMTHTEYQPGPKRCQIRVQDRFGRWEKFKITFTETP